MLKLLWVFDKTVSKDPSLRITYWFGSKGPVNFRSGRIRNTVTTIFFNFQNTKIGNFSVQQKPLKNLDPYMYCPYSTRQINRYRTHGTKKVMNAKPRSLWQNWSLYNISSSFLHFGRGTGSYLDFLWQLKKFSFQIGTGTGVSHLKFYFFLN